MRVTRATYLFVSVAVMSAWAGRAGTVDGRGGRPLSPLDKLRQYNNLQRLKEEMKERKENVSTEAADRTIRRKIFGGHENITWTGARSTSRNHGTESQHNNFDLYGPIPNGETLSPWAQGGEDATNVLGTWLNVSTATLDKWETLSSLDDKLSILGEETRHPPSTSTAAPESDTENSSTRLKYSLFQTIVIAWIACCLALLTVLGNILVMISFKIDKQLQTISNYFLFSLAVADFMIGTIGMPLATVYLLTGYWPFGQIICDTWLAVDYLTSNASVLNLLIISFDRYFSVTRPLTYRARRTTRRAAVMISSAWIISLLLWPPWIYAWPYIEGKRTVPEDKCYIQFIETNHYITFGTAIAAFYIPVSIMLFLYYKIWKETEKRQRDLSQLQAGKKDSSRRSNSSDEAMDVEEWKKVRSNSCTCPDYLEKSSSCPVHGPRSGSILRRWMIGTWSCLARLWSAFTRFCRVDSDQDEEVDVEEDQGTPGLGTPASVETPLQSSVSRCTSMNVIRDPLSQTPTRKGAHENTGRMAAQNVPVMNTVPATIVTSASIEGIEGSNGKLPSSDSVYTILIRIPGEMEGKNASIRMIQDPGPVPPVPLPGQHVKAKMAQSTPDQINICPTSLSELTRRPSAVPPLNAKVIAKPLTSKGSSGTLSTTSSAQPKRKKKKNQEKKQEKKAAKTLSAILLAFIVTWTPYNILVLLKTIMVEENAIPEVLWDMAYYLCYINSTINPMCYALCNASFRRTYVRILTCKWDNSRRQAVNRGYYN